MDTWVLAQRGGDQALESLAPHFTAVLVVAADGIGSNDDLWERVLPRCHPLPNGAVAAPGSRAPTECVDCFGGMARHRLRDWTEVGVCHA